MFDWLIRLLGGVTRDEWVAGAIQRDLDVCDYYMAQQRLAEALKEIAALDTPSAAHGVKRAVKIANEALKGEN